MHISRLRKNTGGGELGVCLEGRDRQMIVQGSIQPERGRRNARKTTLKEGGIAMKKRIFSYAVLLTGLLLPIGGANAATPDQLVALGEAIYKDANLSKNANQSCMTCHDPSAGFADPANLADPAMLPVSQGSFPDRFGGRNAPTASYAGFSPIFYYDAAEGLYIGGMFWDGRATGLTLADPLAEQALGPFLNPVEMALSSKTEVIAKIQESSYAKLFTQVFGPDSWSDVDAAYDNVGRAVAAFERSAPVSAFKSRFDKFWTEQGKDVSQFGVDANFNYVGIPAQFKSKYFTRQEAEGLALFNATDKGKCALCHLTANASTEDGRTYAPLFTDFTYDNLGVPVNPRIAELAGAQPIDYGLGTRLAELEEVNPGGVIYKKVPSGTPGGGKVLVDEGQAGKFKVPTLRNVGMSAPYAHNGFFATLEEITHFYNTRDVGTWPSPEVSMNVNSEELGNLGLTAKEEAAIVAFMRTLND
jgi:cytochrome c peroxidase